MQTTLTDVHTNAPKAIKALRAFWMSPSFMIGCLVLNCVAMVCRQEPVGAMIGIFLICFILVTSDDVFATLTPFLLMTVLVSGRYDSYDLYIQYVWMIPIVLLCLVFHFCFYRGHFKKGWSLAPLLAVSVAVTLGGVGVLDAATYFSPAALYYVLGLGFGMVLLYLLLKASAARRRDYDLRWLLLLSLYMAALAAVFYILLFFVRNMDWMLQDFTRYGYVKYVVMKGRNVFATFILLGVPAPFFFAREYRIHLFSACLMLFTLLLTGSRGGILCGFLLFALCFLYYWRRDKHRVFNTVFLAVLVLLAAGSVLLFVKIYAYRFAGGLIKVDESRMQLLRRAWRDFLDRPVFGKGLAYQGNTDIYDPKTFAMNWYHMMIPQIVASTGLCGVAAYGFLFYRRAKIAYLAKDALSRALSLCYVALFLMSQVNPGEFCPMPYAFVAMLIFAFLEEECEQQTSPCQASLDITKQATLVLLSNALFDAGKELPPDVDFADVFLFSQKHAVYGVVSEGLTTLPEDAVPKNLMIRWQSAVMAMWRQNEALLTLQDELLSQLQSRHIPAAILKGAGVARHYPSPELRVSGDIDCLIPESAVEEMKKTLMEQGFRLCDEAGEEQNRHHVALMRGRQEIELHFRPSGIPQGAVGEALLAELSGVLPAAKEVSMGTHTFAVPNGCHQALILLLHMQQHMREGGLGLRQVCDWALFVASELTPNLWQDLAPKLHRYGLYTFAVVMTTLCVRHLGLPAEQVPFTPDADSATVDALLFDFLESGNFGAGSTAYAGSALLTKERGKGGTAVGVATRNIARKCREKWRVVDRCPWLLPFAVPVWIVWRLCQRDRARVHPLPMLRSANRRGKLYDSLHLFEENARDARDARDAEDAEDARGGS